MKAAMIIENTKTGKQFTTLKVTDDAIIACAMDEKGNLNKFKLINNSELFTEVADADQGIITLAKIKSGIDANANASTTTSTNQATEKVTVNENFINQKFNQQKTQAIKEILCEGNVVRQTEKAYLLSFDTNYGKFESWIPKSRTLQ